MNNIKCRLIKSIPIALTTGIAVYIVGRMICREDGLSTTINPSNITPENANRSILLCTSALLATTGVLMSATVK